VKVEALACLKGSISKKKKNPTPEKGIRNNEKEEGLITVVLIIARFSAAPCTLTFL
jgi:hypothetical protein